MKRVRIGLLVLCFFSGLACTLTSPTPASWAGTPTAQSQAKTETVAAQTAQSLFSDDSTEIPFPELPTETESTNTPSPLPSVDGPWLIFPMSNGRGIEAFDVEAQVSIEVDLPQPIIFADLLDGRSPGGGTLMIRAGSPENLDELALYQVKLPEAEVTKITPLLSLRLQRQIVNQESNRALETFQAVTREPHGLSWSPDGRFLAFSAALDNASSDLYLYDTWGQRVRRINGLYSHNGSPSWSPDSSWLVSQEFDLLAGDLGWRAVNFTALRVPDYDDQNTLYLPPSISQREVLLGWVNSQSFFCYSQTTEGPQRIREVNVDKAETYLRFDGPFTQAAFDPGSKYLSMIWDQSQAASNPNTPGIYGIPSGAAAPILIRAGNFSSLVWDPAGIFIAAGPSGVLGFPPEGTSFFLSKEAGASLSPSGNWLIAWGEGAAQGARLYQPPVSNPLQTLIESPVKGMLWQPDSRGFFLLSEGTLYHFVFPGLNPETVAVGLDGEIPPIFTWLE